MADGTHGDLLAAVLSSTCVLHAYDAVCTADTSAIVFAAGDHLANGTHPVMAHDRSAGLHSPIVRPTCNTKPSVFHAAAASDVPTTPTQPVLSW